MLWSEEVFKIIPSSPLFYRAEIHGAVLNDLQANQLENNKLRSPNAQIQCTLHIMLKHISVLKAYWLFTYFDSIWSSKWGNRKCLFIYKYMGKQFPFIFLKNSVTNKKSLIHSSIAHKIHSFYFDSQYELFLNNKHATMDSQVVLLFGNLFFKKKNLNFKRQSVYKGSCIWKILLHWTLEDWMSTPLKHDL